MGQPLLAAKPDLRPQMALLKCLFAIRPLLSLAINPYSLQFNLQPQMALLIRLPDTILLPNLEHQSRLCIFLIGAGLS